MWVSVRDDGGSALLENAPEQKLQMRLLPSVGTPTWEAETSLAALHGKTFTDQKNDVMSYKYFKFNQHPDNDPELVCIEEEEPRVLTIEDPHAGNLNGTILKIDSFQGDTFFNY